MATLTNADFLFVRDWVYSQPALRAEFKAWSLTKSTCKAALQAIEDYMVSGFSARPATSSRAAIEAVTGATTALRAQLLFAAWVTFKLRNLLEG